MRRRKCAATKNVFPLFFFFTLKSIFHYRFDMQTAVTSVCVLFWLYLKWTLAVVVLHFFVCSTNEQHSGTVILREGTKREEKNIRTKSWRKCLKQTLEILFFFLFSYFGSLASCDISRIFPKQKKWADQCGWRSEHPSTEPGENNRTSTTYMRNGASACC